jgi:hypothetical protein
MRLHEAARAGDVDLASAAVDAAVSRGVPLPAVVNAASDDVMRRSPLHLASEKGHVRAVQYLLSRGRADPNVADVAGARPLHYAAAADREEVARALLAASADASARDARGEQPVHWAAATGAVRVASILLAQDPRAWAATTEPGGWTPLHLAARNGRAELAERLLNLLPDEASRRAALEARVPATGRTPASVAARAAQRAVVETLVAAGATRPGPDDDDDEPPTKTFERRGFFARVTETAAEGPTNVEASAREPPAATPRPPPESPSRRPAPRRAFDRREGTPTRTMPTSTTPTFENASAEMPPVKPPAMAMATATARGAATGTRGAADPSKGPHLRASPPRGGEAPELELELEEGHQERTRRELTARREASSGVATFERARDAGQRRRGANASFLRKYGLEGRKDLFAP